MDDLLERIAATRPGPAEVTPLDAHLLVRRSHRQRTGRRVALTMTVAVAITVAAVVAWPQPGPGSLGVTDRPRPPAPPQTGEWSVVDMPIAPRLSALVGESSSGELVVFGGSRPDGGPADGAILNPQTGVWRTIPALPGPSPNFEGGAFAWSLFEPDRLVVVTKLADGVGGAWYDLATETWSSIPGTDLIDTAAAVAFDGATVAVIQTGSRDGAPAAPRVARYNVDSGVWTEGAAPPFDTRADPAVASRAGRVLIHGGNLQAGEIEFGTPIDGGDDATAVRSDQNFLYNTTADSWTVLEQVPLTGGVTRTAVWLDDDHVAVVSFGAEETMEPADSVSKDHAAAVYQVSTGEWTHVAPPADAVPDARISYRGFLDIRTRQATLTADSATGAIDAAAIYDPQADRWIPAPGGLSAVETTATTMVALAGLHLHGSERLDAYVRTSDGQWATTRNQGPPPRSAASTIAINDQVFIVGGEEQQATVAIINLTK